MKPENRFFTLAKNYKILKILFDFIKADYIVKVDVLKNIRRKKVCEVGMSDLSLEFWDIASKKSWFTIKMIENLFQQLMDSMLNFEAFWKNI